MDRVVTAQAQLLGQITCRARQGDVDAYEDQLVLDRLEVLDGLGVVRRREPVATLCRGQRGAALRVGEDAGRRRVPGLPKLDGKVRAVLGDDQLD